MADEGARVWYMSEAAHENWNVCKCVAWLGDEAVAITIAGATIGKCAMLPKEILPANTNQALAIIRLAKGN